MAEYFLICQNPDCIGGLIAAGLADSTARDGGIDVVTEYGHGDDGYPILSPDGTLPGRFESLLFHVCG